MRVKIGEKYWNLVLERNPYMNGKPVDGYCDPPAAVGKRIVLRKSITKNPERFLCCLIHEVLHAYSWQLDESLVTGYAEDAARIAAKFGLTLNITMESERDP
jgi:hypothetical protein